MESANLLILLLSSFLSSFLARITVKYSLQGRFPLMHVRFH